MGWNDIANNQAVTSSNLQNAVDIGKFTALTTFASSNNLITKAEAVAWVNCWTGYSPLAAKANNQLVVKSDLVTTTTTAGIIATIEMGYLNDGGDWYFTATVTSGTTANNIQFLGNMTGYTTGTCNNTYQTNGFDVTLNSGSSYVQTLIGFASPIIQSYKIVSATVGGTSLTTSPQTITVGGNQYSIFNYNVCLSAL